MDPNILNLTTTIVSAHVAKNAIPQTEVPALIQQVYATLASLGTPQVAAEEQQVHVVGKRRTVFPNYIICLEDGEKLKVLKRHLRTKFNMSPEQYRQKWNLPGDYPMTAPNYSEQRRVFAMRHGLGRIKPKAKSKVKRKAAA